MIRLLVVLSGLATACAGAQPVVQAATTNEPGAPAGAAAFPDDERALAHFRSLRFHLTIPLPDGRSWRIDDHSRPELIATHPATRSTLLVALFTREELMNRQRCEARAREMGLVPSGELRTVEDAVTVGPAAFDTRVWVALAPGTGPGDPLVGHVLAFGSYIHKCLVFHYASEVATDKDEPVLSGRLAVARTRILGGIEVIPFAEPSREAPP